MESYAQQYAQSVKEQNIKELTAIYKKWEKKGEFILGAFVGKSAVTSSMGGGEYNQYLFDTDEGLTKFSMGKAADGEVGAVLVEGKIYRIEFDGQESITGGRRVNKFKVVEVGFAGENIGGTSPAGQAGKKG